MKPSLGIIGLGLMGQAFANRLAPHFTLITYDAADRGGSAADVFDACERILLSLPDSNVVAKVLKDFASHLRPGQIILDTTTGDPADAARLSREVSERQVAYLDTTISGSSAQVTDGTCTVMAGGNAEAFERCRDIFASFAQHVFHVGDSGNGAKMKLVTNLVLGLNRAALAEALVFARELGLDDALSLEVMRHSPAASRIMEVKGEKMIKADFTPQARLSQHLKDVRLILAASSKPLPLSEAHRALLEKAEALGCGPLDNSAIIRAYE